MKRIFAKTISLMLILSIFMSIPAWAETEPTPEPTPTATTNTNLLDIEQYQFMRGTNGLEEFKSNSQFLMPANISATTPTTKYTYTINNTDNTDSTKTGTVPLYENAVDNIVVVENVSHGTDSVSCWFRTIIAVEHPEGLSDGIKVELYRNMNESVYKWTEVDGFATINGVRFRLYVAEYKEVLAPGNIAPASLYQLYLPAQASSADAALFGDGLDVMVITQCIESGMGNNASEALKHLGDITAASHPFKEDGLLMTLLKKVFTNK